MFRLALLALLAATAARGDGAQAEIAVQVSGVRSDAGQVCADVFAASAADAFPTKRGQALRKACARPRGGAATIVLEDLPPGFYAAFAFHDENGDGKIDTNFIGMPKEGVGASRGAKGHFGPPSFEDARFEAKPGRTVVPIRLRYL